MSSSRSVTPIAQDEGGSRRPATVPWRRVAGLLRPIRWGLAGMVGLSVGGDHPGGGRSGGAAPRSFIDGSSGSCWMAPSQE